MQFTVLREANTETLQFPELQRKWTQVAKELKEVDGIKCLNNPIIIQSIFSKLPSKECGDQYIQKRRELWQDGKSKLEILSTFIKED